MNKLSIGQPAPIFQGLNQDGKKLSLVDLIGKKIILYFYPKDNTPGCTAQSCNLRDNYTDFINKGFKILGVSTDSESSHQKFKEKFSLPFDLIADTDHSINEMYGTWKEKVNFGKKYWGTQRTTFIIDEKGLIEEIINKVDTKNHSQQISKNQSN